MQRRPWFPSSNLVRDESAFYLLFTKLVAAAPTNNTSTNGTIGTESLARTKNKRSVGGFRVDRCFHLFPTIFSSRPVLVQPSMERSLAKSDGRATQRTTDRFIRRLARAWNNSTRSLLTKRLRVVPALSLKIRLTRTSLSITRTRITISRRVHHAIVQRQKSLRQSIALQLRIDLLLLVRVEIRGLCTCDF